MNHNATCYVLTAAAPMPAITDAERSSRNEDCSLVGVPNNKLSDEIELFVELAKTEGDTDGLYSITSITNSEANISSSVVKALFSDNITVNDSVSLIKRLSIILEKSNVDDAPFSFMVVPVTSNTTIRAEEKLSWSVRILISSC